jgi:hypothetical protein
MDGRDGSTIGFFLPSCYFIPITLPLVHVNQSRQLFIGESYHSNILVKRLARELERNVGNYAGEGKETAGGRNVGDKSVELHSVALA